MFTHIMGHIRQITAVIIVTGFGQGGVSQAFILGAKSGMSELFTFYRAMLCIRGTSHGPACVRLSVCLSVSVCHKSVFY